MLTQQTEHKVGTPEIIVLLKLADVTRDANGLFSYSLQHTILNRTPNRTIPQVRDKKRLCCRNGW